MLASPVRQRQERPEVRLPQSQITRVLRSMKSRLQQRVPAALARFVLLATVEDVVGPRVRVDAAPLLQDSRLPEGVELPPELFEARNASPGKDSSVRRLREEERKAPASAARMCCERADGKSASTWCAAESGALDPLVRQPGLVSSRTPECYRGRIPSARH
jgi:hypothetical protein